ncbi:MAG: SPFH domain-containing protein [Olsenella sp.]|nr:SPFH domain-containing protein [Olsenella sp.]
MDEIRCDEKSYLIWKWRPSGQANASKRENAIRWGSSLRVREGSVAVFVNAIDERKQDYIEGPFDGLLETGNLPVFASLIGKAYDGGTPFQAEVYFINLAQAIQVKFGVPYFDLFDPRYPDFGVPAAVRGSITFGIKNYRDFVRLHGLNDFELETFREQIRGAVTRYAKSIVANAPSRHDIPVVQIESRILEVSELVEAGIRSQLERVFGVTVSAVDIEAIELDKQSEGYKKLMEVTRDTVSVVARARAQADAANVTDMQRIRAKDVEESLRVQREESQYAQRMQTIEDHMEAYRASSKAEVARAAAESLGTLGSSGGDTISDGFSPAGMMAGMAVGGTVAKGVADMMAEAMGSTMQATRSQTPPPIPRVQYNAVIDGKSAGPFSVEQLAEMLDKGMINRESFVWAPGMTDWTAAANVPELSKLFRQDAAQTPPPIPPEALL